MIGHREIQRMPNQVTVLRCGVARDALRVPYAVGIRAHAYLRWARMTGAANYGDALVDRRRHLYFMVPTGADLLWPDLAGRRVQPETGAVLLTAGSVIVTGSAHHPSPRFARWLSGPTGATTALYDLRHALAYALAPPGEHRRPSGWILAGVDALVRAFDR